MSSAGPESNKFNFQYHENIQQNAQRQRQAEMFSPNGFSFDGVQIKRLLDKPKSNLNPKRKALNYRMGRDMRFESRSLMFDSIMKGRNLRVKDDPNVCGKLKIKKEDAIFSEHSVNDFESTINELRSDNHNSSEFAYDTRYFYNSELNGLSYTEDGKKVTVDSCVCSPWDRSGLDLHSARLSETKDKKSIFYAGRPDTDKRLELQGIDIFLNELETKHRKGFVHRENGVIELHYIIDSLSTVTQGVGQIAGLLGSLDEGKSLEWERAAIKKARKNNKPLQVVHNGKTYPVLLRPIQVHNSVSFFASYNFLEFSVEDQINRNGYKKLMELYELRLRDGHIEQKWQQVGAEIIKELRKHKDSTKIDAGMRIAMIDMLSKICNLPIVHHCKSVVDRTTGAAAVSIVNQMLFDRKFDLVGESFIKTVESELYKHLFVRALKSQLPVSSDVRSAVNINGTINTKRVLPGLEWHTGDTMVAFGFSKLMPEEALRKIPTWKKVGVYVVTLLAFLPSLFLSLVVRAVTLNHVIIPIILPTWLKPKYSFDHHSELLSEGGTRPVLNGPHNNEVKKSIKAGDPTTHFLLAQKGKLEEGAVLTQKHQCEPATSFKVHFAKDKFETDDSGADHKKDYERSSGIFLDDQLLTTNLFAHSMTPEEICQNRTDRSKTYNQFKKISEANFQKMNTVLEQIARTEGYSLKYLQDLLTQKYLNLPVEILYDDRMPLKKFLEDNHFIPTRATLSCWKIDTSSKVVTYKCLFNYQVQEKETKAGFEIAVSFPFDPTKEFDIHFQFLIEEQFVARTKTIEGEIKQKGLEEIQKGLVSGS